MKKTIKLNLHHTGHEVYFYRGNQVRRYDLAKDSKRFKMFSSVWSHYADNAAKYGYRHTANGFTQQSMTNEINIKR